MAKPYRVSLNLGKRLMQERFFFVGFGFVFDRMLEGKLVPFQE